MAALAFAFARPAAAHGGHGGGGHGGGFHGGGFHGGGHFHGGYGYYHGGYYGIHPVYVVHTGGGGWDGCTPEPATPASVDVTTIAPSTVYRLESTDVVEVDEAGWVLAIRHATTPPTVTTFAPGTVRLGNDGWTVGPAQ